MDYPYPEPGFSEINRTGQSDFIPPGPGTPATETAAAYLPRHPEESILYGVVAEQLETFLERQDLRGRLVPRFVERELRSYLDCGILANGFLRVHCDACRQDRVVPFSCKGRGFCPSCGGRHMADTAAHLVDRVFPRVPVRQWVLSLPFTLRYRLGYDARLVGDVLNIFVQAVFGSLRRRAGFRPSQRTIRCGAVTFIQRFGDGLNLNVHRQNSQPLLAELYGASIAGRVASGPRAGRRTAMVGDAFDLEDLAVPSIPRCATIDGFSVHANVAIPGQDRMRLERLCRLCRPPARSHRPVVAATGR